MPKMAGILCSDAKTLDIRNAVWNFGYTWWKEVGKKHAGLYDGFISTTTGAPSPVDQESTDYANSVKMKN